MFNKWFIDEKKNRNFFNRYSKLRDDDKVTVSVESGVVENAATGHCHRALDICA